MRVGLRVHVARLIVSLFFQDLPTLRISLLGGFDLRVGDERRTIDSPRAQALLAYLALNHRAPQPRQLIAFRFWPDSTEKQALTNLRNLLHQLRRSFTELDRYMDVGQRTIALCSAPRVVSDVAEFESALDDAGEHDVPELEEAIRRYTGDLLPGFYDEWLLPEQGRLRARLTTALTTLLRLHEASRRIDQVIATAERLVRHDPVCEEAHRTLIRGYADRGDRARALHAYHSCVATLERELNVAPDDSTRRAYEDALGIPETAPERPPPRARTSLVGRDAEWRTLVGAWTAAMPESPMCVLVSGEAGIGKTRLVEELAQWLTRRGDLVSHVRAYEADGALAFAPIVEWLRSTAVRPAIDALPTAMLGELSRLLPELSIERSAIAASVELSEAERRRRLYDAVAHAIHTTPRPLTLLLDDLQWCDRETLDLVYHIVRRTPPDRSLVVVGTIRTEEVGPEHPLHSLTNRLTAQDRITRIDLRRLDVATTAMLAEQASGRTLTRDEAAHVFQRTDGNPLFVLETLRHGLTQAENDGPVISPRVHAVIDSRLRQLSAKARELAALAATVGREFTIELLRAAADWSEETLLNTLDELWRRRIVSDRGANRYDFTHDRVRDVAYLGASPVRRHELHVSVARALERLHAGDPAASGELAWHYDRGGHVDEAVTWYTRAARAAHMRSALEGVARPLRRALELLDHSPGGVARDQRELEVLLPLGAALVAIGGYASTATVDVYRRARAVTERLGHSTPAPVARALALASIATSDLDASWSYGEELARAGERDGDVVMSVEGQYVLGVVAFWKGELRASRTHLEHALERYRPERRHEHLALYAQDPQVVCLSRLSWTLWQLGRLDEAMRKRDDALALADRVGDPHSYGYALWFTLFPVLEADDRSLLHEQIGRLERVADEHRLAYLGSIAGSFAGYASTLRGDYHGGVARMEAALTDPRATGQEGVLALQTLLLLARAHSWALDDERALSTARSALQLAERGARVWEGELHRLVGESLAALGAERGDIESAFSLSIAVAQRQGARWTALRAHTSLALWRARHGGHAERADSARALAEALEAVERRSEVPAVLEAARLLEQLR